eukprot:m.18590 g.18590  ORF g.18590 m.18590 type:complete len:84 (+) comp10834_c0_seq3:405-656(+)
MPPSPQFSSFARNEHDAASFRDGKSRARAKPYFAGCAYCVPDSVFSFGLQQPLESPKCLDHDSNWRRTNRAVGRGSGLGIPCP